MDVNTIRFALDSNGDALGGQVASPSHSLGDTDVLGEHLTRFIDTNNDSITDSLTLMDAPNCTGDPAGPDLIVHFRVKDTGLTKGKHFALADCSKICPARDPKGPWKRQLQGSAGC